MSGYFEGIDGGEKLWQSNDRFYKDLKKIEAKLIVHCAIKVSKIHKWFFHQMAKFRSSRSFKTNIMLLLYFSILYFRYQVTTFSTTAANLIDFYHNKKKVTKEV
jgi:hypothetical protein